MVLVDYSVDLRKLPRAKYKVMNARAHVRSLVPISAKVHKTGDGRMSPTGKVRKTNLTQLLLQNSGDCGCKSHIKAFTATISASMEALIVFFIYFLS